MTDKFKLQGCYDFQGLLIAVENKKGSIRRWFDAHNNETGSTKMYCDYGYVADTLGTDGEDVDVYVGPNKNSTHVFVVTQAKSPRFIEIDEQKVMLGFNSEQEAKEAYLRQYNDPRFYMGITYMTIDMFKNKLESMRGEVLKSMSDLEKGLSAAIVAFLKRENLRDNHAAHISHAQPAIGSNAEFRIAEPPPVPVRRVLFYPPTHSVPVDRNNR